MNNQPVSIEKKVEENRNPNEVREILSDKVKQRKTLSFLLSALPKKYIDILLEPLANSVSYKPTIGVIGTTGAGKSSLINGIFGDNVCKTSSVKACTRELQKVTINCGKRDISFIDLPGIGETNDRDEEYEKLYQEILPALDIVIWAIKADDRAFSVAQHFYHKIIIPNHAEDKVLFVITQIDKIETDDPLDVGFDRRSRTLSHGQLVNVEIKKQEILKNIAYNKNPIVGVSAPFGINMQTLADTIIDVLPETIKSNVYSTIKQEYKKRNIMEKTRNEFIKSWMNKISGPSEHKQLNLKSSKLITDVIAREEADARRKRSEEAEQQRRLEIFEQQRKEAEHRRRIEEIEQQRRLEEDRHRRQFEIIKPQKGVERSNFFLDCLWGLAELVLTKIWNFFFK